MPELPEVETICRQLQPLIIGKVIKDVLVRRQDTIGFPDVERFKSYLKGKRVEKLERQGKYLMFSLGHNFLLIVHLRLSGHLRIVGGRTALRYERIRLIFKQGKALVFVEPRALGRVYAVRDGEWPESLKGLRQLGIEPISPRFTSLYLAKSLRKRKATIKKLLLDQRICAGVGNIYSDEALFRARVKPIRQAGSLTNSEILRLTRSLQRVLNDGIKFCGTTMKDGRYQLPDGKKGRFQHRLMVFNREGLPCRVCGAEIKRIRIGNRSSYFCPICQR
ncbi:MAG: bifunctional DNA-formamidopyrimidine glycosylase/DNA-(apurinic or apyrimidinic site) lyase [bacterium]